MKKHSNYSFLFRFIKPQYKSIVLLSLLELVTIVVSVTIPYFLSTTINSLENNFATVSSLLRNFLIIVILYLIWDAINIFSNIKFAVVNKDIQKGLRKFCYEKIFNSSISLVESKSEGEIIQKLLKDTDKLEKAFTNLFYLIVSIIHIIALLIAMLCINKVVTLILLSFFIFIILIQRIFSSRLKNAYLNYKFSEEELMKTFKNFLSGFMNIKIFSLERKCLNILDETCNENLKNHRKINEISSLYSNLNFFIVSIFRISSLIIGDFIYILNKSISIGQIFAIYSYAIQMTTQLRSIIDMDIILKDIETSLGRVESFIAEFESPEIYTDMNEPINKITANNVNFKYKDNYIFKDLSFEFNKNDVVGIIGRNGSGKSSLMKVLCGFYKVDNMLFNATPQSQLNESSILKKISYVPQHIYLFPESIMANISCFGRLSEEDVYKVCKDLNIHNKILSLPEGYDTILDEKNSNLSGGEKQVICIARALLKESDILILDEITSALDTSMEENIIENIKKYYANKIVFIISHKDNIFKQCTHMINIDDYKN